MKKIIFLFFILLFPSVSIAVQTIGITVSCPSADIGRIKLVYNALAVNPNQITSVQFDTNLESRGSVLVPASQEILIKAKCENPLQASTAFFILSTSYNGVIDYTAVWVPEDYSAIQLILNVSAFAFGVVLALSFLQGVKSHV